MKVSCLDLISLMDSVKKLSRLVPTETEVKFKQHIVLEMSADDTYEFCRAMDAAVLAVSRIENNLGNVALIE